LNLSIKTFYFSATGTTRKIISGLADQLAEDSNCKVTEKIDFTLPDARNKQVSFEQQDLVVIGVPVYAGRVPNVLLKYLNTIQGNGALAIAVVVYGNRNYDDALRELKDIIESAGFQVIAGGAFIGEHSFSTKLAAGRPDERDMIIVKQFARKISQKLIVQKEFKTVSVPGNQSYAAYFKPTIKEGKPFHKVLPKTSNDCINCKLCSSLCPMGSIGVDDVSKINGICIKCCVCIKRCPVGAKYFDDATYLEHAKAIEDAYLTPRREPEFFL
jgi:NAD-dependent dihydropyrimidine dehydrogenase PreA subunit/flavodoxin